MIGATVIVTSLVLLCLTRPGVNGAGIGIFNETAYDLTYPCEGDFGEVCFYMWEIGRYRTIEYIAVVSNAEQKAEPEDSNCTVQISDLTAEDVGHYCQRHKALSSHIAPELNLLPNKTASLQCVFLPYVEMGHCNTQQNRQVRLTWVDGAGAAIREDAQHQIQHQSSCEASLTVSLQRAETKTFRCQAAVGEQTHTSPDFTVGASGFKRGRRFQIETGEQGGSRDAVGGAAGVVACIVLTAVVAVFVTNKRRTNSQLPEEPSSVQHTSRNVVANTDDVTYADICFSAGSERAQFRECASTEYACVRYT